MRYRTSAALLIGSFLALSVCVPADVEAATKRKKVTNQAPKPKPTDVLVGQIYVNRFQEGENLLTSCKRSSFKFLAVALDMNADWLNTPKGEFEKSDEFKQRRDKLDNIFADMPVVICEGVFDNPDINLSYEADAEVFKGSFSRDHNVWRDVKPLGTYRSRTRMGVPAKVKASLEMNYDINLKLPSELQGCLSGSYSSLSFSAPASRERAPIIKAGGRFVIVGKLTSPYVETNETEGEPTLDDPYDVYTRTISVSVKPIRVVLIGPTGEEIWSCKPGRFQPSPNPVPLGNQADWIQTYDFPYSARSERKSGSVEVRLTVSSAGSVNDCSVVISSGSTELDIAACTALRRRARFTPAADDDGEPIASHFDKTVRWNFAS